ncbi:cytochrome P450 [Streptomyces sp. NPDC001070]
MTRDDGPRTARPRGPRGSGSRLAFARDRLGFLLHQRQYGDLVRLDDDLYLINSPALVEEVLKHTNTTYTITEDLLGQEIDGSHESEDLARWMRARRVAGHGLNRGGLRSAGDRLAATAAAHAATWRSRGRIEAIPALEELSAHLVAEFCLGPETGRVPALVSRLQEARLPGCRLPSRKRRLQRAGRDLAREVSRLVGRREAWREDSRGTVADLLVAARDEGAITHEGVLGILVANLFAAHETTAAALAWLFLLLDRFPDVRRRVVDEASRETAGRLPTAADLPRLIVTEAVVKETLRLYPPLWLLRRTVSRPTELAGYPLRSGQRVAISPFVLHRDPRHYGQPAAFLPDRWIDRSPADRPPKYAFMPFGGGPRTCLGAHFGTVAMAVVTATVAGRHRFSRAAGTTPCFDTRSVLQPRGLFLNVGPAEAPDPAHATQMP